MNASRLPDDSAPQLPLNSIGCPYEPLDVDFDPFGAEYVVDPYPIYELARRERPVFYSPRIDYWVLTRYDDVRSVFRNHRKFSPENAAVPVTPLWPSSLDLVADDYVSVPTLIDETPPTHPPRRRRIARMFTAKSVAPFEQRIRDLVGGYIDEFVSRGEADLVAELAFELPAIVMFMMMGVPDSEAQRVKQYATARLKIGWGRPTEEEQNRAIVANNEYWAFCGEHIERLRADLGDDALSDAIRFSQQEPELMDEIGVRNHMMKTLFAGHETTTGALANAFRDLLGGDGWSQLCASPNLVPSAVEESLRLRTSVVAWRRKTLEATNLGGVGIPADANLLLVLASANHDEEIFPNADVFDLTRDNMAQHLSFGHGAHMCIGAPLARLEMRVVFEELTRRLPHMELVDQDWDYEPSLSFRGPRQVRVKWDAAANPDIEDRP